MEVLWRTPSAAIQDFFSKRRGGKNGLETPQNTDDFLARARENPITVYNPYPTAATSIKHRVDSVHPEVAQALNLKEGFHLRICSPQEVTEDLEKVGCPTPTRYFEIAHKNPTAQIGYGYHFKAGCLVITPACHYHDTQVLDLPNLVERGFDQTILVNLLKQKLFQGLRDPLLFHNYQKDMGRVSPAPFNRFGGFLDPKALAFLEHRIGKKNAAWFDHGQHLSPEEAFEQVIQNF